MLVCLIDCQTKRFIWSVQQKAIVRCVGKLIAALCFIVILSFQSYFSHPHYSTAHLPTWKWTTSRNSDALLSWPHHQSDLWTGLGVSSFGHFWLQMRERHKSNCRRSSNAGAPPPPAQQRLMIAVFFCVGGEWCTFLARLPSLSVSKIRVYAAPCLAKAKSHRCWSCISFFDLNFWPFNMPSRVFHIEQEQILVSWWNI